MDLRNSQNRKTENLNAPSARIVGSESCDEHLQVKNLLESRVSIICLFSLSCFSLLSACMDDFFSFQHEESSANSGISTLKVAIQPSGDRQVS